MLQRLLGNVSRGTALGTIRNPARGDKPATTEYRRTMAIGGTGVTFRDAISLVNGDFALVAYYTVQAQEEATFGWGDENHPDNQGYIYFQAQTSVPGAIDGPTRFILEDAHGAAIAGGLVLQEESTRMDASATDRRLQLPLPKWPLYATEDSRLAIRMDPSATAAVSQSDSTVQVPITLRRVGR